MLEQIRSELTKQIMFGSSTNQLYNNYYHTNMRTYMKDTYMHARTHAHIHTHTCVMYMYTYPTKLIIMHACTIMPVHII